MNRIRINLGTIVLVAIPHLLLGQGPKDILPQAPEGKKWQLVWHDEFDGSVLDEDKWDVPPDGKRRKAYWMRKAISLDGKGHLAIRTIQEDDKYIDGCVRTKGKFEHTFGYYVARIQFQSQPGHWPAFWLLNGSVFKDGNDGWNGTEIDICEKPWLDDRVQQAIHWGVGQKLKSVDKIAKFPGVMEGWHTFGLLWLSDQYVFYIDGKETWRTKAADGVVCQMPLYIKLSDEIGPWGGDIRKAKLPDQFLVDYVRAYDLAENKQ